MTEHVHFEVKNKVATITLDRPDKLNALSNDMLESWLTALEECRVSDEVNVIVFTGTGRAFSTGGDVSHFGSDRSNTPVNITSRLKQNIQRLPRKLADIDKPIIAALNGFAVGAGLDIALMCDIRFAAESARFAETYLRMGLIPGAGGAYFLPRILRPSQALMMFWTSDFVDAREAERLGLVDRVFPDEVLMKNTYELAERIAKAAPLAVRLTKRILYQGLRTDLSTALDMVAASMPVVSMSEDHQEAVRAFKEKREPTFTCR